jgi:hypothetical protein
VGTVCYAAACSTTHVLHLGDPQTGERIHEMALVPGTIAALTPLPGGPPLALKYDVVGVPSLFLGVTLGFVVANASHADAGMPASSMPTVPAPAYALGAIFAIIGAVVGAAYGAAAGHRDIYLVRP